MHVLRTSLLTFGAAIALVAFDPAPTLASARDSTDAIAVPLASDSTNKTIVPMQLGAFSISLTVKDIKASKEFYEKLGFKSFGGDIAHNWAILKNGDHIIGLFQGMFEKNMLTFNPGWDQDAKNIEPFTDIRALQKQLKAQGVTFKTEADESTTGPASFVVVDPDGNPVLVDQHR
jgi:lactoylglutathione lyase